MKWALVAAGLKDLARPVEKLSVSQNLGEHPFFRTPGWRTEPGNSPGWNGIHLGSLLFGDNTNQLQPGRSEFR
jgi:hypothetical protein